MMYDSFLRLMVKEALLVNDGMKYATLAQDRVYDFLDVVMSNNKQSKPYIFIETQDLMIDTRSKSFIDFTSNFRCTLVIAFVWVGNNSGISQSVVNIGSFIGLMLSICSQQILDALIKSNNVKSKRFSDNVSILGDITYEDGELDGEVITYVRKIKFPLMVGKMYNSELYPQDRLNILDNYPEFKSLISCPAILAQLSQIGVINDGVILDVINADLQYNNNTEIKITSELV